MITWHYMKTELIANRYSKPASNKSSIVITHVVYTILYNSLHSRIQTSSKLVTAFDEFED